MAQTEQGKAERIRVAPVCAAAGLRKMRKFPPESAKTRRNSRRDDPAYGLLSARQRKAPSAVAGLRAERVQTRPMRVDEFDFTLPEDRIALHPASPRDTARLLHVRGRARGDFTVRDLPSLLRPGDLMVLNDTKVIPAQLAGQRPPRANANAGGEAVALDVTLHKRLAGSPDIGARWAAFVRPAKRIKEGERINFSDGFFAEVENRDGAEAVLRFNVNGAAFDAALAQTGAPPLPPYIARKRRVTPDDANAYQTIFADEAGSVAAPTAGLHFTPRLFDALDEAGVARETITLHVGAGTFLPVSVDDVIDHVMHAEWGEITEAQADRINAARAAGGRIIAVGTTAARLLESAADKGGVIRPFKDETDIFITPGYRFRAVDVLMTNFHLPRSTLFMLVSAFAGTGAMKRAYSHAVEHGYRFYSYGDACLLERSHDD
ncbi:MAG: tRNA preQ1(34) S-adenosylmethionine ribosyltransferase-isomerase QueA [Parvularculaceae bacterium]